MLVKAGADVKFVDKVGVIFPACMCVPRRLCILIHGTHYVFVILLVRLQYGFTPVRWAVMMCQGNERILSMQLPWKYKIVEMLIKAGADANVADKVKVIFPACVCVSRRLCILILTRHSHSALLLALVSTGRLDAAPLGYREGQQHDRGDAG
jgi:hypothetical protein